MTFAKFASIIKKHHPDYIVTSHGYAGNKNTVAVQFSPDGKAYTYKGSYFEIAKKLSIPCISESVYNANMAELKELIAANGLEDDFFGGVNDFSEEIAILQGWLESVKELDII